MAVDPIIFELSLPKIVRPYAEALNTEILPGDGMFFGNRHHYFACGASALNCILNALNSAEIEMKTKILDFGCGAGRVTRWLRAAFPDASIHASDVREQDLEFVQNNNFAKTWLSGTDISQLESPESYDIIWVGSVFTHLSANFSARLFDRLCSWLRPQGVLIFSVHGRFVMHRAKSDCGLYGVEKQWDQLTDEYQRTGFGYADYPGYVNYGISVSKSSWWIELIESRHDMRLACISERAWDRHHDVITVQKANWD